MIKEVKKILERRNQLAIKAYDQFKQITENLITSKTDDINQISYTLDFMLDFCFDDKILQLYRKLCRYLYSINANAAIDYVNTYRQIWDEKGTQFGNNDKEKKI